VRRVSLALNLVVWPAWCDLSSFTFVVVCFEVVEKNSQANNTCLAVMALQRLPTEPYEVSLESLLKSFMPPPQ